MSVPYHRLGRALGGRWWSPFAGFALIVAAVIAVVAAMEPLASVPGVDLAPAGSTLTYEDPIVDTAAFLVFLGLLVPILLLVTRLADGRPAGTLSSVDGHLRWPWVRAFGGLALLTQVPLLLVVLVASLLGDAPDWPGWREVAPGLAVVLVLVPFQAAGEEYLFRGWAAQAAGRWLRSPWLPAVVLAALFSAIHVAPLLVSAYLFAFALLLSYVTLRTGGLEAAIVLHVAGNVVAFTLDLVDTGWDEATATNEGILWYVLVGQLALEALFVALVVRWVRRRHPVRVTAAIAAPATGGGDRRAGYWTASA